MGKIVAVGSGKGGTGKTTSVAAISSCLAALGYKTLAVDLDAGLRSLDLALSMTDYSVADYEDVLSSRLSLMEACHEHPLIPNLFFLSAPAVYSDDEIDISLCELMFSEIRREFDYCLLDSPSGIGHGFRLAHMDADLSILVTNGELPTMRDAERAADIVRELGVPELRLLVNRVRAKDYKMLQATIDDVIDTIGVSLLGIIREDKGIMIALHENTPLVLHGKRNAAYDFLDAARRITGEKVPLRRIKSY
ncbi:MAG: AAA family ATPase [Oscillospiraceae bacterium]|nr:AAA family ATPase [Oscillospiraceae bacterium]